MAVRRGRLIRQGSHNVTDLTRVSEEDPLSISGPSLNSCSVKSSPQSSFAKGMCILVMGLTGAGKSTFISQLTQHSVPVGHSLGSCTVDVYGYPFHRANGHTIWLIDTPGFDDTNKANAKILREIVSFMCTVCNHHKLGIGGLLYIHRITDIRMSSSSLKSLRIFEALCGETSFKDVTIVTTMWDVIQTENAMRAAEAREVVLQDREHFFGRLRIGGAGYERHQNTRSSSLRIIEGLANRGREVNLAVQLELERNGRTTLADTTVGRYLEGDLMDTRRKYENKMIQLKAISKSLEGGEDDMIMALDKQSALIKDSKLSIDHLFVTYEGMQREREARIIEEGETVHKIDRSDGKPSSKTCIIDRRRVTPQEHTNDREAIISDRHARKPEDSPIPERPTKEKPKKESSQSPWSDFLRALFGDTEDTLVFEKRRSSSVPPEIRDSRQRDSRSNRPKRAPQSREWRGARKLSLQDSYGITDHNNNTIVPQQLDVHDDQNTAYLDEDGSLSDSYIVAQIQLPPSSDTWTSFSTTPPTHSGYGSGVMVDPSPLKRTYTSGLPYTINLSEYSTTSSAEPWGRCFNEKSPF